MLIISWLLAIYQSFSYDILGEYYDNKLYNYRALADCLTFKNIRTITEAIYQKNQFTGTQSSLFNGVPTTLEKNLAERVLRGEYYHPATNSLWFYAPAKGTSCKTTWYDQEFAGRYKSHCFYIPDPGICKELH